jgi:hypothetical protein
VTDLAPVLQGFFSDRLARQKKASPNTVAAYRDTCRLLLAFAQARTGKPPSKLSLADLDATLVGAFLNHLEDQRGNGSATRNARLAAVHSLFKSPGPGRHGAAVERPTAATWGATAARTGNHAARGRPARLWPPSRRLTRRVRMAMPAAVSANPGT